jgi:hypothetical protein
MAKRKFKNKSWCMFDPVIIESDAFLNLSGKAAMLCLIRFHQKAHRKNTSTRKRGLKHLVITNNGEIIFTYGEARELGIKSPDTFYKVIRELVEDKGFIDVAESGHWYEKKPTKYSISQRWKRYGTPDYEKVKIPRALPKGKGFQKTKLATVERSQHTTVDRSEG